MTQLSRKQKYQELRDRLDEETTAAQAQPVKMQRLSRVDNNLSHANKPLYPHDTVRVSPTVKEMPTSPVMEDLLGEVKQYNIENGNRITDDTQINILKQLDTTESKKRNQHVIPMETDDEDLGSTMKISKPRQPEFERSTRIESKEEKIVLSSQDMDVKEEKPVENDDLDLMYLSHDDFDKTEEQPKKEKKKKAKRKKEKRDELESMPSAKMRMKTSDFEKASKHKEKKSSEIVLNVVLAILIIALVAIIGYLIWTFKNI